MTVLSEAATWVDFFFVDDLPDYDLDLLVPRKMTLADVPGILNQATEILSGIAFTPDEIETALRNGAKTQGLKAGQMFQPIRVAICGKKVAPPLFDTVAILGKEMTIKRINQTLKRLETV